MANSAFTVAGSGGGALVPVATATASSSASVAFTNLSSVYRTYQFVFNGVLPATNQVDFVMRTSTNNGSSYDSGGTDYTYTTLFNVGGSIGAVPGGTVSDSSMGITKVNGTYGVGNAANAGIEGVLYLYNPSASAFTNMTSQVIFTTAGGGAYTGMVGASGWRSQNTAVNAVQFFFSSGNIASGTIDVYGILPG